MFKKNIITHLGETDQPPYFEKNAIFFFDAKNVIFLAFARFHLPKSRRRLLFLTDSQHYEQRSKTLLSVTDRTRRGVTVVNNTWHILSCGTPLPFKYIKWRIKFCCAFRLSYFDAPGLCRIRDEQL